MTLLLPVLAVAFAAFCVWLAVRIVNRRERWAKWMAVGLVAGLPALYIVSFGPAWWLASRGQLRAKPVARFIYQPLIEAAIRSNGPVRWWAELGATPRGLEMNCEYDAVWCDIDIPWTVARFMRRD